MLFPDRMCFAYEFAREESISWIVQSIETSVMSQLAALELTSNAAPVSALSSNSMTKPPDTKLSGIHFSICMDPAGTVIMTLRLPPAGIDM